MSFITMSQAQGSIHLGPSLRNRIPILLALKRQLDPQNTGQGLAGYAVDLSGGTGAHLEVMAPGFPTLEWRATEYIAADRDTTQPSPLAIIDSFSVDIHKNVHPSVPLDLSTAFETWHETLQELENKVQLALCCNVIHITPWAVAEGLFRGVSRLLQPNGTFALYGPFIEDGQYSSDGNRSFDAMLQLRNPDWGLRERNRVEELAASVGLKLRENISMPANNKLLLFVRTE